MRIRANIWHLIGRLYQPAAWRIFITKSIQANLNNTAPSIGTFAEQGLERSLRIKVYLFSKYAKARAQSFSVFVLSIYKRK
jgi:hypothetical protein